MCIQDGLVPVNVEFVLHRFSLYLAETFVVLYYLFIAHLNLVVNCRLHLIHVTLNTLMGCINLTSLRFIRYFESFQLFMFHLNAAHCIIKSLFYFLEEVTRGNLVFLATSL